MRDGIFHPPDLTVGPSRVDVRQCHRTAVDHSLKSPPGLLADRHAGDRPRPEQTRPEYWRAMTRAPTSTSCRSASSARPNQINATLRPRRRSTLPGRHLQGLIQPRGAIAPSRPLQFKCMAKRSIGRSRTRIELQCPLDKAFGQHGVSLSSASEGRRPAVGITHEHIGFRKAGIQLNRLLCGDAPRFDAFHRLVRQR